MSAPPNVSPCVVLKKAEKKEFLAELGFDIKNVSSALTKLKLRDGDNLPVWSHKLDSPVYNLNINGWITEWRIYLKMEDEKEASKREQNKKPGLGVYLQLLDCREQSELQKGGQSDLKKVQALWASFCVKIVNCANQIVLTYGDRDKNICNPYDKTSSTYGYVSICALEDFRTKRSEYYSDGTLRVRVSLKVLGPLTYSPTEPAASVQLPSHNLKFMGDFLDLLTSGRESDLNIICGETTFKVHRLVLSARSPVFRRMLESKMTESKTGNVEITDIEPEVMDILLKYIYSSNSPIPTLKYEELLGLVKASDKYELHDLKDLCFLALTRDHLNMASCGELAVLAYLQDGVGKPEKALIYEYCQQHWSTLIKDPVFKTLVKSHSLAFLRIDDE